MPNATITSTASTFGTISGTFAADQSTIAGTISGVITGTLDGSVGVPGPQGPAGATGSQGPVGPQGEPGEGVPTGGTTGQYLVKTSGVDFATGWQTLSLSGYLSLDGGEMNANAEIYFEDTVLGRVALASGSAFAVSSASNPDLVSNLLYDRIFVKNATSQTSIIPTGVEFPDLTIQTTGFTGWNNVALTGNPTAPTAALADNDTSIATTAFVQQELASGTANARNLEVYVRNQTGSTLAAGTIVYINGATGNRPTVTPAQANNDANSAQTFGFVKTSIANNGFGFVIIRGEVENLDTSALTEGVQLYLSPTTAGAYTTTKPSAPQHLVYVGIVVRAHPTQGVILAAIQNGYELNEIHDVAISSITDGDLLAYESATTLWKNKSISTLGLATQSWVTSQGYLTSASLTGYAQLSGATFTGLVSTPASTTSSAGFRIVQGVAPTSPTNGDVWQDGTNMNVRIGGATQVIPALGTANTFTGNVTFNGTFNANGSPVNFGAGTGSSTIGIGPGLTASGSTKTINIGVNSLAGSTTTITIGSTAGTSTTTLQGITNGVTQTAGTGNTTLATTAFVTNADNLKANLDSPVLTGSPLSTTAAADTNSTRIATTAYVVGQASAVTPLADGTAAVGTSLRYARADHVHPTDTSLAPLASPSLTGVPISTTAAADTNTTQIATTAYVVGQASSTTPSALGAAAVGTSLKYARADHVHQIPLPTGGTTGQVLSKVDGTNYNVQWSTASGGGGGTDYQAYTTSGTYTWTKPANAKWVEIYLYGAGGGGGSGARYATSSARSGGGGGSGGAYLVARIPASALGATETVTVGAGGAGGLGRTVDTTNGLNGSNGGNTTFSIFNAAGGALGVLGSTTSGPGGTGRTSWSYLSIAAASTAGGAGNPTSGTTAGGATLGASFTATGGGGGAGAPAANTIATAGGNGSLKAGIIVGTQSGLPAVAGGSGGTTSGTAPTTGVAGGGLRGGGTGGGGGAYRTAVAGMDGANGAAPGGGGGGGSASDNGFASGAGGAGGAGVAYIITYC